MLEPGRIVVSHWLHAKGFQTDQEAFHWSADLHEEFLDWATRRDLAPLTPRVFSRVLTSLGSRHQVLSGGHRKYTLPARVVPDLGDLSECPTAADWSFLLTERDYPWIRYYEDDPTSGSPEEREEALSWSREHGFRRPPQMGWPWWRIPLPGEIVPAR